MKRLTLMLLAVVALFGSCKKDDETVPTPTPSAPVTCDDSVYFKWKTIWPYADSTFDSNSYFIADSAYRKRGDAFGAILGTGSVCKIQIFIDGNLRKDTVLMSGARQFLKPAGCDETAFYSIPF